MNYYDPEDVGIDPDEEFEQDVDLNSPYRGEIDPDERSGGVLSLLDQQPLQPDQRVTIGNRLEEISTARKGALQQLDDIDAGRSRTAEQKRAIIKEAKGRLLKQRPDNTELLLSLSGALLSPTRTGAFTESLGNAATAAAPQLARMREFETNLAGKLAGFDLQALDLDEKTTGNRLNSLFKRLGIADQEQRFLLSQLNRPGPKTPTRPRPYTYRGKGNRQFTEFYNVDGTVERTEEGEAWKPNAPASISPAQDIAIDMQIERLIEADLSKTTLPTDVDPEDYRNQRRAELYALYKPWAPRIPGSTGPDGQPLPRIVGRRLSEGQKVLDREWAKDNNDFMTKDFAEIRKNINSLDQVVTVLQDKNLDTTGSIVNALGPDLRRWLGKGGERSADLQQLVESVVQQNLRQVLGGQFAEREGANLIKRAYNPSSSEEVNIAKLSALKQSISQAAEAKRSMADYFRKNNTLTGYEGPTQATLENDVLDSIKRIDEIYSSKTKPGGTRTDMLSRREELLRKQGQP